MSGTEALGDVAIILGPLVGILDHQLDRRAGGLAFKGARQDAHKIIFPPLGGVFVLPRLAGIQPGLKIGFGQCHAGGAAIHGGPNGRPVAFAPGGDAEKVAEGVQAHCVCSRAEAPGIGETRAP